MSRYLLLSLFACVCPLLFPWQVTIFVTLLASWFFPFTALIVGGIEDALYAPLAHGHYGLLVGAVATLSLFGVRHFVNKRIIQL